MNKGKIEQCGTPAEIYDHPATAFVMSFIGPVNVLNSNSDIFQSNGFESTSSEIFLRPQDVAIDVRPNGSGVAARIERIIHLGGEIKAELVLADGQNIVAHLTRDRFDELQLEANQQVFVKPKEAKSFPLDYSI
jgi:sulfate/thiosulfate transport system ATP-binding protein